MTAKIKLNAASGGGSVSFQAPSSTGDDRIITLPTSADGTVLTTTNPKAGNIIQVVQTVKTDTFSTTSPAETAFVDTGLSVAITPSATSSKILILWNMQIGASGDNVTYMRLQRGSTDILLADTSSTRVRTSQAQGGGYGSGWKIDVVAGQYLDAPSTTSATTYKWVWASNGSATAYMNRSGRDHTSTNDEDARTTSSITAMEVAG